MGGGRAANGEQGAGNRDQEARGTANLNRRGSRELTIPHEHDPVSGVDGARAKVAFVDTHVAGAWEAREGAPVAVY